MKMIAVFDVDEEALEEQGVSFGGEIGWVTQTNGIDLDDWFPVTDEQVQSIMQSL